MVAMWKCDLAWMGTKLKLAKLARAMNGGEPWRFQLLACVLASRPN